MTYGPEVSRTSNIEASNKPVKKDYALASFFTMEQIYLKIFNLIAENDGHMDIKVNIAKF